MKPKFPYLLPVILFLLWVLPNACLHGADNPAVKDIEYLTGDDFVQLHFKIDKMIPIPEVTYPEKDNLMLILIKFKDIPVQLSKDRFNFNSPLVDYVEVLKTGTPSADVKIHLKQPANYRVFTNQKGLFVEFPNAKASVSPTSPPPAASTPAPPSAKPVKEHKNSTQSSKSSETVTIKEIVVSEKDADRVKFRIVMTGPADYTVVPVPDAPIRLAIDLKNTRSKSIKKPINYLNVKAVRGGVNSGLIYRVVFDLLYLKEYHVAPSATNPAILEVEFTNGKTNKGAEQPSAQAPEQSAQTPDDAPAETPHPQAAPPSSTVAAPPSSAPAPANSEPIRIKNDNFAKSEPPVPAAKETISGNGSGAPSDPPQDQVDAQSAGNSTNLPPTVPMNKTLDVGGKVYTGQPMNFNFHNGDLKDVIKIITKMYGKNILLDPDVAGRVTSQMTEVPWDQALELFLKINGLAMVEEGNIWRIGKIDRLAREAAEVRKLKESQQLEGDLKMVTRTMSYAKVADIAGLLKNQLSERGEILIDPRTNTMVISDVPSKVDKLDKLIENFDLPTPQVSIEARFVETRSNFSQSLGIQWGYNFAADSAHGNQTTLKFPNSIKIDGSQMGGYAVNLPASTPTASTLFSFGNIANTFKLDMALSAMESKGQARVISAPKTTTQNNKEAYIMNGRQIPFQTLQNNTISIQYKAAALELKVTPQITAKETIICELEINNNSADFANVITNVGVPIITQTIKTTVMVDNGGTIVIGGIYQVENSMTKDSVPLISKIPLLGNLFKRSTASNNQKELLIFITPRIIK
ncbi:MAG: type IV pilus secretin PilQ [Candidatus Omnitrophota bacterium]